MSKNFIFIQELNFNNKRTLDPLVDVINQNPKYVILFNCMEFDLMINLDDDQEIIKKINDSLIEKNIILYVVQGGTYSNNDKKFAGQNIKHIQWPTYLLHWYNSKLIKKFGSQVSVNKKFEKLFVSYNNRPRSHRCMLMDSLSLNNLMDYGKISWLMSEDSKNFHVFKHWDEKFLKIDNTNLLTNIFYLTDEILDINVFFNLVTETCHLDFFVSEKTYKPLLLGQPFICLGGANQNNVIKSLGFKLYDEIFDYEFDTELILENRVQGIIDNIIKLKDKNFNELYELIKDKIQYNRDRALDIIANDPFIPQELISLFNENPNDFIDEYYKLNIENTIPNLFDLFNQHKVLS
jgi:hypothetical protein